MFYARARAYIELIRDVCSFELSCGRTIDDRGPDCLVDYAQVRQMRS